MHRSLRFLVLAAAAGVALACQRPFQVTRFATNEELFQAGLREYENRRWENAILAFEKLTTTLSPRDTLLSRSFWYLAGAHAGNKEYLLAAQSYSRLVESFPDDSLADDAALASARQYRRLWRSPSLDATYGETALAAYGQLATLYPQSPLAADGEAEATELRNWFAQKDYLTGLYYFDRKAFDSAELYFRGVLAKWPDAPAARTASLRLVEVYRAIRAAEDMSETCTRLRRQHAGDAEVTRLCTGVPDAVATDSTSRPAAQP